MFLHALSLGFDSFQPLQRYLNINVPITFVFAFANIGGDLGLCDHCPRVFHAKCVGLRAFPKGDWQCPECVRAAAGEPVLTNFLVRFIFIFESRAPFCCIFCNYKFPHIYVI